MAIRGRHGQLGGRSACNNGTARVGGQDGTARYSKPRRLSLLPAEIISHAVWLYFRFPLSLRMVDDLLAAIIHQPGAMPC